MNSDKDIMVELEEMKEKEKILTCQNKLMQKKMEKLRHENANFCNDKEIHRLWSVNAKNTKKQKQAAAQIEKLLKCPRMSKMSKNVKNFQESILRKILQTLSE